MCKSHFFVIIASGLRHGTFPQSLSFLQSAERCQCLTLSLLTVAKSAGARGCMNLRDVAILALEHLSSHWLAKPSVLGNLVFVSRDSSVLEPGGLWFGHEQQLQCHCPPASGVQLQVQFLFLASPGCHLRRG